MGARLSWGATTPRKTEKVFRLVSITDGKYLIAPWRPSDMMIDFGMMNVIQQGIIGVHIVWRSLNPGIFIGCLDARSTWILIPVAKASEYTIIGALSLSCKLLNACLILKFLSFWLAVPLNPIELSTKPVRQYRIVSYCVNMMTRNLRNLGTSYDQLEITTCTSMLTGPFEWALSDIRMTVTGSLGGKTSSVLFNTGIHRRFSRSTTQPVVSSKPLFTFTVASPVPWTLVWHGSGTHRSSTRFNLRLNIRGTDPSVLNV